MIKFNKTVGKYFIHTLHSINTLNLFILVTSDHSFLVFFLLKGALSTNKIKWNVHFCCWKLWDFNKCFVKLIALKRHMGKKEKFKHPSNVPHQN